MPSTSGTVGHTGVWTGIRQNQFLFVHSLFSSLQRLQRLFASWFSVKRQITSILFCLYSTETAVVTINLFLTINNYCGARGHKTSLTMTCVQQRVTFCKQEAPHLFTCSLRLFCGDFFAASLCSLPDRLCLNGVPTLTLEARTKVWLQPISAVKELAMWKGGQSGQRAIRRSPTHWSEHR